MILKRNSRRESLKLGWGGGINVKIFFVFKNLKIIIKTVKKKDNFKKGESRGSFLDKNCFSAQVNLSEMEKVPLP